EAPPTPSHPGDTMFIAILDFGTTMGDRACALAQLDGERPLVSSMPGNLAFRVYASREDDRRDGRARVGEPRLVPRLPRV
ncbi:MAG: hypothetical protein ABI249_05890, partial [Ornithinibacter sp.]